MLDAILNNYAQFLNLGGLLDAIGTWNGLTGIFILFVLEGLLSADNALVLAMMVKPLPEDQQQKALTYGIWGAYIFRFLIIGIGTLLIKLTWVKAVGALYLIYMAVKGLFFGEAEEGEQNYKRKSFFMTILSVEAMDIVFSIDSVTAALAISDKVWVVFLGAVFGILAMRFVAQRFIKLIKKVPELEKTAFLLIAIIGIKLGLTIFGIEIHELVFYGLLIGTFLSAFIRNKINNSIKEAA